MRRGFLTGATVSLLAAAAIAQPAAIAAPAASQLSLNSSVRAETSSDESLQISPAFGAILGVVGIIAGAVIVVSDDEDSPSSP